MKLCSSKLVSGGARTSVRSKPETQKDSRTGHVGRGICKLLRTEVRAPVRNQHAFFLEEALVYIAVLLTLLGVGYSALYRSIDSSIGLRRNADDITSAVHAGERWRADVLATDSKAWLEKNSPEAILHLPSSHGEIAYRSAPLAVYRRVGAGPWVCALTNVASSIMESDSRQNVIAWRWELELQHRAKGSYIRPLFTFMSVPQIKAAP